MNREDHELQVALGRQVRAVRIARGVTQVDTADLANVSLGALKHLESGAGSTTATLVRVLRALGKEQWFTTLVPDHGAFNPLEVLEARETDARTRQGPPRASRRRGAETR